MRQTFYRLHYFYPPAMFSPKGYQNTALHVDTFSRTMPLSHRTRNVALKSTSRRA
jgi:hypothetical protein